MRLRSRPLWRGALAGLAGGVAWFAGTMIFFGPAQRILANPDLQSAKFLAAVAEEPLPRGAEAPWLLVLGVLGIGLLWGWIYVWISRGWPGGWARRGLRFAVVAWVLMVPWFQFYLPWNVMREPAALVALEMLCWAGVMLAVGLTLARVDAALGGDGHPALQRVDDVAAS